MFYIGAFTILVAIILLLASRRIPTVSTGVTFNVAATPKVCGVAPGWINLLNPKPLLWCIDPETGIAHDARMVGKAPMVELTDPAHIARFLQLNP